MNKLLNVSEVLVLSKLYGNGHNSTFKGADIEEIIEYVSTVKPLAKVTIRRIISSLLDEEYIELGIKRDNRRLTYYCTEKGSELIREMIVEGGK